jgi:uncharacterized protein
MAEPLTDEELAFLQSMFELARTGDPALLEHVDAGLPVNLTNGSGDTLLILAAYHHHPVLVRGLLDRGADHGRVNDRGQTALAAAVFRQREDIVTMLVEAGADAEAGPRSAVAIAEFFELPQMMRLLRP